MKPLFRVASLAVCAMLAGTASPCAAQQWKDVFDPLTILTLNLTLDPADWDRVRHDQPVESETWIPETAQAMFHADGETPILVSIRRKGPTDPPLPSAGNPQKVSMKIDINDLVPGQRWRGLRKLSLENGGEDPLAEGFSWQIHRRAVEAGMYRYDAANAAWVRVIINGDYKGIFTNAEQRDEQFLRNRDLYSPTNTWLYKIDGGATLEEGIGDSPAFTHLCYTPFSSGPGMGGGGCPQPDLEIDLPQWVDMQGMLTLGACNAFVENNDGLITHSGKNSFAIDFNPPQDRPRLYLPWDLDAGIKNASNSIYGNNAYQTELLDHYWFGQVYEHILRDLIAGPLSVASLHGFINDLETVLTPAVATDPYVYGGDAAGAFTSLRNWVTNRVPNVGTQYVQPFVVQPQFNQDGGEVVNGFELTMTAPTGQVYYTTDGSDPRGPGGVIAASASLYSAPVVVDRTLHVIARTYDGVNWSGLPTEATFNLANFATALRVTEIMYHPADEDPMDAIDEDAYEFIEFYNSGATALDISNFFLDGITYTFPPGSVIPAGAYVVLVRDAAAFGARYPAVTPDGIYLAKLSNGGEKVRLKNADGTTVISVEYDDDPPWVISPDGLGYSLVNLNLNGEPDDAANWRASTNTNGSPGAADPAPPYPVGIFLNEVLAHSAAPFEDAIEVHHTGAGAADISGWFLSDEARDLTGAIDPVLLKKFELPTGTTVAAGGFAAFYELDFNTLNTAGTPFSLSEFGGRVYLSSADGAGNLTGSIIALDFPATESGVSFGRIGTSTGPQDTLLLAPTFGVSAPASQADFRTGTGAANSAPKVGPVIFSEIMYNPPDALSEYVELHNISGSTVDISDWDIDGISGFAFPPGTSMLPGGFVLLIDTAKITVNDFRTLHAVPAAVPIFGDLFDLGNGGESLRLEKPNPVPLAPDIRVERVRYNDKAPWPTEPDGAGPSLERFVLNGFGNEPLNWRATAVGKSPGGLGTFDSGLAIAKESFWDYFVTASALASGWKDFNYNATSWPEGTGALGYGEAFLGTVIPFGGDPADRHPTTYFRKPFVVNDDPATVTQLDLSVLYDDGVAVYLNGTEVLRRSLPAGGILYSTLATADNEAGAYEVVDLLAFSNLLVQGTNVLAVEVHQFGPASSDLVWDAELIFAAASTPPDTDGDGMTDAWEDANGLEKNNPNDAAENADGDLTTNLEEFLAGTDPNDPGSMFRIATSQLLPSGSYRVQWASVAGKTYRIIYSPDLVTWFSFGPLGDVTATSAVTEFIDPSGSLPGKRFYRIEVLNP